MALTDTFIKKIKSSGAPAGDKHTDGQGLYLLVKPVGKYWRMNYRFAGKQKTLALGTYPEVSLAKARKRLETAREQLADSIDPSAAKKAEKADQAAVSVNTFKAVAMQWHAMKARGAPKTLRPSG
ncbi:MAG: Arm DNA-binding domain-containing protein [Rhodoferax sp.]|nr:Arm DNA-binding domain-containing protein [Rhodoferax sp.]